MRLARAGEIAGGCEDRARPGRELARDGGRVRQGTHAQRQVDPLADEVDHPVVEDDLDIEVGVLGEKARQQRHHVKPREGGRRRDRQSPREPGASAPGGKLRLVGLGDGRPCPLVEAQARLRGAQAVRRANEQADLQPVLQLRDRLRDGGLAHVQEPGGAREGARFHDPHEGGHRLIPVHAIPPWNERYRPGPPVLSIGAGASIRASPPRSSGGRPERCEHVRGLRLRHAKQRQGPHRAGGARPPVRATRRERTPGRSEGS